MGLILSFGIPLLLGYLFQQLYNVVDTAIVGKTLGGQALAAVGATSSVNFLVVGFCTGVTAGFSIPVSREFGANRPGGLRRYVTNGAWLSILFALLLTVITVLGCRGILTAMQTPEDILERSRIYIGTIFAGLPAYFLYNYCAGVLRAMGDSKTPVFFLILSSVTNVVLDVLFIMAFHWDVFGAAFATVLSQLLAGLGCLIRLCVSFPILEMEPGDWRWNWERVGHLCMMGLPMGLQYSITGIGSVMIQSAVNTLGTAYVTAVTAASKVFVFLACPYDAMGSTMATYGGQNVGARRWEHLHQGMGACVILGAIYSLIALVVVFFCSTPLTMLFLDQASAYLAPLSRQYLMIEVLFFFPLALVNIVRFMIQGMGFSPLATLAGLLEMVARAGASLFVPALGFLAACFASPAAWILADLFLIPAYFYCCRHLRTSDASPVLPE